MITIEESNMTFGPYEDETVFYIEKSEIYKKLGQGVQISEFVLLKDEKIIFVEAKSSSPQPTADNTEKFKNFIEEIAMKLNNSLDLFISANLGIKENTENENVKLIDIHNVKDYKIKFYLVINGHEKEWLTPLQNALNKKLLPQRQIWNVDVTVLNDEFAKKYHLILT